MALDDGRVLQRWFDCWCPVCMSAKGPSSDPGSTMNSNYQVPRCVYSEPWWECSVQLHGTKGIAAQRKLAQKKGREYAKGLKPGTFIAAQDREDQNFAVPFIIGVTVDTGDGSCIVRQDFEKRQKIDGTMFDPGDCAIAVRWLRRVSDDSEQRSFEYDATAPQMTLNSTELRCVTVELDTVKQARQVRRSRRAGARAAAQQHALGDLVIYELAAEAEQTILNSCW